MKNILESIGMSISHAVDCVVEKNRKSAQINRLKLVIRREERISEKAYIALGKYYYHNLRDENDPVTEPHCAAVDQASRRMDRAITRLEELFTQPGQEENECSGCDFDCSSCQGFCDHEDEEEETPSCEEPAKEIDTCCCKETAPQQEPCCQEAPTVETSSAPEEVPVEEEVTEPAQPPVENTYSSVAEAADPRDNREIPFQ